MNQHIRQIDICLLVTLLHEADKLVGGKVADNNVFGVVRQLYEPRQALVGIEITGNKVENLENKIELLRQQWWISNHAYNIMRYQVRTEVIGKTGMNWGQYIPADEMSRVKRVNFRKGQLTMEQYQANKQDFWSYARDAGMVEMPRDDGFASST